MSDDPQPQTPVPLAQPKLHGASKKNDDRLKAALKANMARRKAQARARHAGDDGATDNEKE